jgi:triosephosphate isomerase
MARRYLVGGNWKSNGTLDSVRELIETVLNPTEIDYQKVQVVVAPVYVHIPHAKSLLRPEIELSAQNASLTSFGAYTGEITVE